MEEAIKKYLSENGKKGGKTTRAKYDDEHFIRIGKMGGRPRKVSK